MKKMMQFILTILMITLVFSPSNGFDIKELLVKIKADSGCSTEDVSYNQVQIKASHNSYERDEKIFEQLDFSSAQPWQAGCRAVEFDCRQDKNRLSETDDWRWSVQHDGEYSTEHTQLREYLEEVNQWSQKNQNHDVITVHLEMKDVYGDHKIFAKKLDELLLTYLVKGNKELLFTPADMLKRGEGDSLVSVASVAGWPKLKELRNKFIVVLTGGESGERAHRKTSYAENSSQQLAFVDLDVGEGKAENYPDETMGNRLFLNLHVYQKHTDWHDFCHKAAKHKGFIVRAWKVNHKLLWQRCIKNGVNLLATDKIKNHDWARVGSAPFRVFSAELTKENESAVKE